MGKKDIEKNKNQNKGPKQPSVFGLLGKYKPLITILVIFTILANALSLLIPKLVAHAIDSYIAQTLIISNLVIVFSVVAFFIFVFTYLQNIVQVYASEKVAKDLRAHLVAKISEQAYTYVENVTPAKLLTNLTSDVDSIKTFVSTAVPSLISSAFLIIGTAVLLLTTDWRLGLIVLSVVPVIALTFAFVLGKVRKLFVKSQEAIDGLNKVISESILGAALIRLLFSQDKEYDKFFKANTEAKRISLMILGFFSSLIPIITFCTNIATLMIVLIGGQYVIHGSMSFGDFTAFNSYLAILIFPVLIIGFMSNLIAQAQASYGRILQVLDAPLEKATGTYKAEIRGDIELKDVSLIFGEKTALDHVSFSVKAGSKTAIIGPTAVGKTQLVYLLTGLLEPTEGTITYDGKNIREYDKGCLHSQVGFVFQDSIMFNLSLRENIAFSTTVDDASLKKAIDTAELGIFIDALPEKLETIVSERGTSLSGGQKQRIMLARALALNPKVLFLDDFTARVDNDTERKILENVAKNYPDITLISITQKIASIEKYDQIILLEEGELVVKGRHEELLVSSPEYIQIYQSQRSTSEYEAPKTKKL